MYFSMVLLYALSLLLIAFQKLSSPPEHISLSSTFPSRPLPETSNEETLSELGLCPSSVIIVKTKVTHYTVLVLCRIA